MQFCGDDSGALIGDLGSRKFKFGFAGEDTPKGSIYSFGAPSSSENGDGIFDNDLASNNNTNDNHNNENELLSGSSELNKRTRRNNRHGKFLFENARRDLLASKDILWARK